MSNSLMFHFPYLIVSLSLILILGVDGNLLTPKYFQYNTSYVIIRGFCANGSYSYETAVGQCGNSYKIPFFFNTRFNHEMTNECHPKTYFMKHTVVDGLAMINRGINRPLFSTRVGMRDSNNKHLVRNSNGFQLTSLATSLVCINYCRRFYDDVRFKIFNTNLTVREGGEMKKFRKIMDRLCFTKEHENYEIDSI
ncbi:hypothetical protein SNEBB_011173 [Seison nebaliae]|nr:hypothetical protein SNEBB_011173 [Seison nebaliae]